MDQEVLVAAEIEEGKHLLEALDKAQLQIRAAFWIYYGMTPTWKLMIGSSHPDLTPRKGLIGPYSIMTKILRTLSHSSSLEGKIEIIDLDHKFVKALSSYIFIDRDQVENLQFSGCPIGGIFFEGLYIYRLDIFGRLKNKNAHSFRRRTNLKKLAR